MARLFSIYREKYKNEVVKVDFRDKSRIGWSGHIESYIFNNKMKKESNIYTYLFYSHIMFRKSCYKCHYTNTIRPSDLTIADYWGWEKTDNYFNVDNKGCSLIMCNTIKGKSIFFTIQNDLNIRSVKKENCLQPNMCQPSYIHKNRNIFEYQYGKLGFNYIMYRYANIGIIWKLRQLKTKITKLINLK